jgi:hypothetical protein
MGHLHLKPYGSYSTQRTNPRYDSARPPAGGESDAASESSCAVQVLSTCIHVFHRLDRNGSSTSRRARRGEWSNLPRLFGYTPRRIAKRLTRWMSGFRAQKLVCAPRAEVATRVVGARVRASSPAALRIISWRECCVMVCHVRTTALPCPDHEAARRRRCITRWARWPPPLRGVDARRG